MLHRSPITGIHSLLSKQYCQTFIIRHAFVQELLDNISKYKPFFINDNYETEAMQSGFFVGVLEDLMPTAMAEVLQAPIVNNYIQQTTLLHKC